MGKHFGSRQNLLASVKPIGQQFKSDGICNHKNLDKCLNVKRWQISSNARWWICFLSTSEWHSLFWTPGGSRKFVEGKQSRRNMSMGCDKSITDSLESEPLAQQQWLCQTQQWREATASSPRPHFTKDSKSARKLETWNYLSLKWQMSLNMTWGWLTWSKETRPDMPLMTCCHQLKAHEWYVGFW